MMAEGKRDHGRRLLLHKGAARVYPRVSLVAM